MDHEDKRACLHIASIMLRCCLSIVQYLIENGANIEENNNLEDNSLHIACQNGYLPIVQYLNDKRAKEKLI